MKEYVHRISKHLRPDPKKLAESLMAEDVFSDLTITCGEKRFKVHKNLLWTQSEYFRKLLNGRFKKKQNNLTNTLSRKPAQEANAKTIDLSFDDLSALTILIHYFYNFNLNTDIIDHSAAAAVPPPTLLVRVYAISDKYDVQPLMALAKERLGEIYSPTLFISNISFFVGYTRAIDANTSDSPETHGGLWGVILPAARANLGLLLKCEGFRALLGDAPEFVIALLEMGVVDVEQAWRSVEGEAASFGVNTVRLNREYALGAATYAARRRLS